MEMTARRNAVTLLTPEASRRRGRAMVVPGYSRTRHKGYGTHPKIPGSDASGGGTVRDLDELTVLEGKGAEHRARRARDRHRHPVRSVVRIAEDLGRREDSSPDEEEVSEFEVSDDRRLHMDLYDARARIRTGMGVQRVHAARLVPDVRRDRVGSPLDEDPEARMDMVDRVRIDRARFRAEVTIGIEEGRHEDRGEHEEGDGCSDRSVPWARSKSLCDVPPWCVLRVRPKILPDGG